MDIAIISKIYSIFNSKSWHQNDGNDIVFSSFCTLLLNLLPEQQDLIIELTERYNWITLSDYQNRLIKILNSIPDEELITTKRVILFPVMKPEDEKKTKSGHTILYMLRAFKPLLKNFKKIEFKEIEEYKELYSINVKEGDLLFLLDDYLGSGETIKATIEEVLKNRTITPEIIKVIAIASQKESIDFLQSISIKIYYDLLSQKGISDFYDGSILSEKIKIMEEIEKLISINHFKFGYNDSEALVTLMRTPDNTFPIFWKEYLKNSEKYQAPFSRY